MDELQHRIQEGIGKTAHRNRSYMEENIQCYGMESKICPLTKRDLHHGLLTHQKGIRRKETYTIGNIS